MYYFVGLSRNEIFNETLMMLIAAFDSTSSALSWFIHLMSKYPEVQQKIKAELMKDNDNQQLTLDRLDSLIYLDCVVKEVLRFCPPIVGTLRTLTMDDRLPESGFQLRKGDSVLIAINNLAHDTRYWSIDPELFYPERFLNEDKNHHPYAFIPFGSGHRQCIGQDLARLELKIIAARMMQYVTFGDGGPKINAGGHSGAIIKPRHIGVTINFDS
jgi:cytochrome P450